MDVASWLRQRTNRVAAVALHPSYCDSDRTIKRLLDELIPSRRDNRAAKRLLRKLLTA